MNISGIKFTVLLLALAPWLVHAGGDEVVVIYNNRMPGSKLVAEHYAQVRHVPEAQVYGFDLPITEEISRAEFQDQLQFPLASRLVVDNLWQFGSVTNAATNGQPAHATHPVVKSKIRYAVLCYGVPLKIAPDPNLHEPALENVRPELLRNEAAVDSELAWLPLLKMNVPLSGPLPNWVYGVTNPALLNPTNGILLVARLDGPSVEIALGLVDKALVAERDGLWGRAYFDARGLPQTDTNYIMGDEWILNAGEICRELGFETTVDKNPATFPADFPMSQIAIYCGWYDANVSGPFALPRVEFMPGAFAYHLHSSSAVTLRSTNQFWVGPLLAKGATCTMGCVYEPYLSCTPNVAAFLARLIVGGFTFGEAAWAAQPVLSWQTTVVGDPLYRPFGREPSELHAEFARTHNPLIEWSYLRVVNLGLARSAPVAQLATFLETIPATTNSAVLTEKLADLFDMLGKSSLAIETRQRALALNPSPEQRIRLRLTLGEKLLAQHRDADAIENYQQLLKEAPDYPGQPAIEAKLAALEPKSADINAPAGPKPANKPAN
ncbi:MAG: TIGR03790 family protein [Verrucomicrobiota bacterium]